MSSTLGTPNNEKQPRRLRDFAIQILRPLFVDDRPPVRRIDFTHRRQSFLWPLTRALGNLALGTGSAVMVGVFLAVLAASARLMSERPELRDAAYFIVNDQVRLRLPSPWRPSRLLRPLPRRRNSGWSKPSLIPNALRIWKPWRSKCRMPFASAFASWPPTMI